MCHNGGMGRRSRLADNLKTNTDIPAMMAMPMAVLRLHCGGLHHQPPEGAQTYSKFIRIK
jgi:hypothetical protein